MAIWSVFKLASVAWGLELAIVVCMDESSGVERLSGWPYYELVASYIMVLVDQDRESAGAPLR
jgi:hypothetical protein